MNALRLRFGRPLRLAVIGGGPASWIGTMHRTAAELDAWWRVVGGVFSSDPVRSREGGVSLGFDRDRCYADVNELVARERARPDPADAVAIMSPNDVHYAQAAAALDGGLDVICDKPISHDAAQARDLAERVRRAGRLFAITHGYSCYPMTRYARHLVRAGALGDLRFVQVEYLQGGYAARVEDGPQTGRLRWLFDPARSGLALVMSAIGCHAQHLACFVTGRRIEQVSADAGAIVPGRSVIDTVSALLRFEGGLRGTLTTSQAAAGTENDIRLRVFGERGMVEWSHRSASYLTMAMQGETSRVAGRGDPDLPAEILALGRSPRGHPEGLRDAFANLYGEVARERIARELGEPVPESPYPRIDDGVHTMAFIEACVASRGNWVRVAG
jgi:predicted dehydrogenase